MAPTEAFAPAKINLTLHVTGQRADGYHLLESLVVFADVGDVVRVTPADEMSLCVTGPMASGVPEDARNFCWRAAQAFGAPVAITLDKRLPAAAGIGGGSSDAAAVLRAMAAAFDRPFDGDALALGADVPVCLLARAARMSGIGEAVEPLTLPVLHAVLVNPRVEVPTPVVFRGLASKQNPPMAALPAGGELVRWLGDQRNDLEAPALAAAPVIGTVLAALTRAGAGLARMSGSGATCFGLFADRTAAEAAAHRLQQAQPDWWVTAARLA
ncbi:4-(cytidine 5'-diphospho)-2-C-methyl-D-erythritol kinase [Marinovum sp.]|uniref:4-(cytidine 5'-diphospho)-2-C-methyl-D-erythritol kinase n=1 Tax=Marinovum sp. TaxID=2024839 RepID=UPI002B26DEAF|nr:4-(cytidine 5'-diphospho)-2-C-methyl-D-erythritol kinase [Marinovum sp.]